MDEQKVVYIYFFDGIDEAKVRNTMAICTNILAQAKPDTLYFLISSKGGDVKAGITLYNFLKSVPVKVVMHNIGAIDSIATVVFAAGDERYAAPNTTFHFHGVQATMPQLVQLSLGQLKEIVSSITQNHDQIAKIVCENTKLEEKEIKKLFLEGESKSTSFASANGIITKVFIPDLPKEALIVTLNSGDGN